MAEVDNSAPTESKPIETVPLRAYEESREFRHLSEIYFELGRTLFQQGEYGESAQAFRDAIRKNPNSSQLHLELAKAREAQERWDDALRAILDAVRLDSSSAVKALKIAHKWLTRERAKSIGNWLEGDWREGIDDSRLEPEARAAIYDFLGRASLYREDFDNAIEHYKKASADNPNNLFILEGTGEALWRSGKPDEAIDTLSLAVKKADESEYLDRRASTRLKLTKVLMDQQRYPEALPILEAGLRLKHSFISEFQIALGRCFLAIGNPDEALKLAESLLTRDPAEIATHGIRAAALYKLNRYQEAANAAEEVLRFEPNDLTAIRLKALALIDGGLDLDQAIRLLQTYTRRKPDDIDCQLLLARTLRHQERSPDEVVSVLEWAISHTSFDQKDKLVLELAQAYLEAKRPDDAIAKLDEAQNSDVELRSQAAFWKVYGDAQKHTGRPEAALESYSQGLNIESSDPTLLRSYGQLLMEGEDSSLAADVWRRVVKVAPDDGEAHLKLAQVLHRDPGQNSIALQEIDEALLLLPQGEFKATAHELKANILELLKRPDDEVAKAYHAAAQYHYDLSKFEPAAKFFDKANKLNPRDQSTYWYLADSLRCLSSTKEYPYVDKDKISQAMELWNKGRELSPPSKEFAWAYLCHAFIWESLARLSDNRAMNLWQAALAVEQMLILATEETYGWPYLARYHRALIHDAVAMHASDRGLRLDDKSTDALSERAWILASIWDAGALEATDRYAQNLGTSDALLDAVKGYVLSYQGNNSEAIRCLDRSLESAPDDVWSLSIRGRVLRLTSDKAKALKDFHLCWSLTEPGQPRGDKANRERRAWVGYHLKHHQDAADMCRGLLDEESEDPFDIRMLLALCCLRLNQPSEAEQWFDKALPYLRNRRHALESRQELEWLKEDLKDTAEYSEVLTTVAKYWDIIQSHIQTVTANVYDREAAERELKQLLDDGKYLPGTTPWLAIQAGLARLQAEGNRWDEAAKTYIGLNNESDKFPEAGIALERTLDALQAEGDRQLREGIPRQALALFTEVLEFALPAVTTKLVQSPIVRQVLQGVGQWVSRARGAITPPELLAENKKKQADLFGRLGYAYFQLGDSSNANNHFIKSLQLYREDQAPSPGAALGENCRSLLRNATDYWALQDEWKRLAESEEPDGLKADFATARTSLAAYLDDLYQLSEDAGSTYELLPVVTPVAVEMGKSLIPNEAGPEWPLIKQYLPEMRARITNEMGVPIPGVRVRDNENLKPEDYVILLDEIPRTWGRVRTDTLYSPHPPEVLRSMGIPEDGIEAEHSSFNAEVCCWVDPKYRELLSSTQPTLLDDPLRLMVSHIERVLRPNLRNFLGVQEVENLIWGWTQNEKGKSLVEAVLPNQPSRFRFARLLRSLVKERVPITAWEEILESIKGLSLGDADPAEAERAVRLRLKNSLPGNDPQIKRVMLPLEIESRIEKWVTHGEGRRVLAMPLEDTQQLLAGIRELLDPIGQNGVLVTSSAELRPFVRRLVELEFPDLMVLAQEEVVSNDEFSKTTLDRTDLVKEYPHGSTIS